MYTERLVSLPSKRAQSAGVGQSPRLAEERRQGRRAAEDVPLKAELPNTADLEDREGKKRAPHKAYEYNKEGRSFHAPLAQAQQSKARGDTCSNQSIAGTGSQHCCCLYSYSERARGAGSMTGANF